MYLLTNYRNEGNIEEEEKKEEKNESKEKSYFVAFVNYFKEKDNKIKENLKIKNDI